jgi:hypothetical protein
MHMFFLWLPSLPPFEGCSLWIICLDSFLHCTFAGNIPLIKFNVSLSLLHFLPIDGWSLLSLRFSIKVWGHNYFKGGARFFIKKNPINFLWCQKTFLLSAENLSTLGIDNEDILLQSCLLHFFVTMCLYRESSAIWLPRGSILMGKEEWMLNSFPLLTIFQTELVP